MSVEQIIACHRERNFAMEQRKRVDLSLGSYLRTQLGWKKDLPDKERAAIAKQAQKLMDEPDERFSDVVNASRMAREPWDAVEKGAVKMMERLAKGLPVWASFGEPIPGFGAVSLAVIVGEAGDLSKYSDHSKLWKRMGLAVMEGVRQGGLTKSASAADWIAHGYNAKRRSHVWNIGDALMKSQVRKVKDANGEDTGERTARGIYGEVYLARKEYEVARDPEIKPIIAHRRAQRYMEKRLLRDLWRAWRQAIPDMAEQPNDRLPAANQIRAAAP
jgi:hypothetical protein